MYTSNGYAYTMPSPASESQPETPVSPEPPAYSTTQAPTTQPPHPIALLRAVDLMDPGKIAQVFCESAYVTSCYFKLKILLKVPYTYVCLLFLRP